MDETFAEAFVNREHTVLGRRLRPLSIFHEFALALIGNPFAAGGDPTEDIDFASLFLAVEICAGGYDPHFTGPRPGWRGRFRFTVTAHRFKRRYLSELAAFYAYLRDFRAAPKHFWTTESTPSACDFYLGLVGRLMGPGHMAERTAWEYPVGKAVWLAISLLEADGRRSTLMTPSEISTMRAAGHIQ